MASIRLQVRVCAVQRFARTALRPALISPSARTVRNTRCRHFDHSDNILLDGPEKARYECAPEAGVWNVHHLAETHHLSIVPFWFGSASQKAFWLDLGHWLRAIDRTPRGAAADTRGG